MDEGGVACERRGDWKYPAMGQGAWPVLGMRGWVHLRSLTSQRPASDKSRASKLTDDINLVAVH